jgi:RNA polymerase sigma-70 factor, ECF subfamily
VTNRRDERDPFLHSILNSIKGPPATPEYFNALLARVKATPQIDPDAVVKELEASMSSTETSKSGSTRSRMPVASEPVPGSSPGLPALSQERSVNDFTALQDLMAAFRDGDPDAFEGLEPQVLVLCYRKARSLGAKHDEAEDVAQEVVVGIWKTKARSFDAGRGSLEGWLAISCSNRLKDLWNRKDRQRQLEAEAGIDVAAARSPEEVVVQRKDGEEVRQVLGLLAPLQREVLERTKAGHTNREIAEELGIPEAKVRVVKFRALQRIRERLWRFGLRPLAGGPPPAAASPEHSVGEAS